MLFFASFRWTCAWELTMIFTAHLRFVRIESTWHLLTRELQHIMRKGSRCSLTWSVIS